MPYEVFEMKRGGSSSPAITVTKDGFYINTPAVKAFNVNDYDCVQYHVNKEDGTIGLKLHGEEAFNSVKIPKGKDTSCSLAARRLVQFYKLERGIYPLTLNEENGLIEFSFKVAEAEEMASDVEEIEQHVAKRGRPRKVA